MSSLKKNSVFITLLVVLLPLAAMAGNPFEMSLLTGDGEDETHPRIKASILDAYYTDLDADGLEDDVFGLVDIQLTGATTYTFDYEVTLILPSGLTFQYLYVITTNIENFQLKNNFFDHALENGWYTLEIVVTLQTGGQSVDKDTYTFDPPGGTCCSDPTFTLE